MPLFRKADRNVLFIHIPKCGGTSITKAFRQSGYSVHYFDGRVGRGTLNYIHPCTPQHWHAAMLEAIFRLERMDVIFSFVREPIARLRSEYLWRHRRADTLAVDEAAVEKWTNESFTKWSKGEKFIFDNHLRPQSEFPVAGTKILKVEDGIENQLADLSDRFDLGLETAVERSKDASKLPAGHRSDAVQISPRLEKTIRRFYRKDFRTFGY